MKRIVFMIIASLLVIGLVLPGMVSAADPTIKILITGPMEYVQGEDIWYGATVAADEINDAGGVNVSGTFYDFELVQIDTDEIDNYAESGVKLEDAIEDNDEAEFIIGGFRTEAMDYQLPIAGGANVTMFICGSASYKLLKASCMYPALPAAGYLKYIFRGTPFNDVFLLANSFMMLGMVALEVEDQGVKPKVAIFAESLDWADAIVEGAEELIPQFGWDLGKVVRVSDKAKSTIVDPKLNDIEKDEDNIIWTVMSGEVGTVFSLRKGALDIPSIVVGINVEAQSPSFWGDTNGGCEYEITMGTWAPNIVQNTLTEPFLTAFETAYDRFPTYTAASYDVLNTLATAMHEVGSIHNEDLISWYEDPDNAQEITVGTAGYYPLWDGSTAGYWDSVAESTDPNPYGWGDGMLPALNSTQIDDLYATTGYVAPGPGGYNFTMPPYCPHDLIYGPTYVTGIAIQWQPEEE